MHNVLSLRSRTLLIKHLERIHRMASRRRKGFDKLNYHRKPETAAFPSGGYAPKNEGFPTDEERSCTARAEAKAAAAKRRRLHLIADAAKKLQD